MSGAITKVGRPTVITDDVVRKLEEAFKDGLSVSEACFVSGIGKTTFYERKASDTRFAEKIELAKQYVTIKAKKTVVNAIDDGNLTASKWWLERKARNEFGTNTVDEEAQWEAQHTTDQSDDVLRQILDRMIDIAESGIDELPTEARTASTALNPLKPDKVITNEPTHVEPATVQIGTSQDDVLADLYGED